MAISYPASLDSFALAVDNVTAHVAQDINDMRDSVEALETKVGIDNSLVNTSLDYLTNSFFETGRRLWLYEDTAPTGWTYLASIVDRVIGVKGGSNAFNVAGGNQAGTWAQPNHTHTGPSHNHKWYVKNATGTYDESWASDGESKHDLVANIDKTGVARGISSKQATPLNDQYTKLEGTGATSNSATANTWRPYGAVGIIVQKD